MFNDDLATFIDPTHSTESIEPEATTPDPESLPATDQPPASEAA